jgi:8-oxo-dGTP diphosphatase
VSERPRLEVAIALVFRDRRLLVTRRRTGTHLAGLWELPGGKLRAGESAEACAVREVAEETRVVVVARGRRPTIEWDYPERSVALQPVDCEWVQGDGELVEVADLAWATKADLLTREFPPANAELIAELGASALLI